MTVITVVTGAPGIPQRIGTGTERLGNKRTFEDHPDYSLTEIGQNTGKSHGNLRRLALLENNQLTHL